MSAAAPQGRVRPLGPLAALVECADLRSAVALHAHLARAAPPGLVDCVAGAETVVVRARSTSALREILAATRAAPGTPTGAEGSRTVTIDVVYDGEDRLDVPPPGVAPHGRPGLLGRPGRAVLRRLRVSRAVAADGAEVATTVIPVLVGHSAVLSTQRTQAAAPSKPAWKLTLFSRS